jgi:hypothetical protein
MDMRMDRRQGATAADIIRSYSEVQLHKMFEQYGEVTNSKTLAKRIVDIRNSSSLTTINEFKQAISTVVYGNPNKYLAQVFQALRIEVNDELNALKDFTEKILRGLRQDAERSLRDAGAPQEEISVPPNPEILKSQNEAPCDQYNAQSSAAQQLPQPIIQALRQFPLLSDEPFSSNW